MKTFKYFETGFATKREVNEALNALSASTIIDGEVNTYADLQDPAIRNGEIWLVKTTTGVVFVNKKVAGLYVSNGTTWTIITPVEIDGYQKLITTPTDGNIVITDANGQAQNGNKKLDDLLALGETSSTAYRGDRGKIAYDHSQIIAGNPHNTTKADVGLSNVDNTSDINKPISSSTQTALNLKQNTISDGAKINIVGSDVASASTVNLDNATGDTITITGTTTINAITLSAGIKRFVRFAGILTLTNGASLALPSGANIITAVGDTAIFIGYASGVVRCVSYERANGTPLVSGGGSGVYYYSQCILLVYQTTNISGGDHAKFTQERAKFDPNGYITLDTTSAYSNGTNTASVGRVLLKAGRTYKITGYMAPLSNTGYLGFSVYNSDTGLRLGTYGSAFAIGANAGGPNGNATFVPAIAFITPLIDTRCELRITSGGAIGALYTGDDNFGATSMTIESWS